MGTYELLFCYEKNAASVVVTCEVVGTFNHYKMVKNLCTLHTKRQWGYINFSIISSSVMLALSLMLSLELAISLVLALALTLFKL